MREIYNPVAQNHLPSCVAHANDAGTQLEYQIVQRRALPEELRLREGGLAELCPDRCHYPGIWLKRNPSFQICQHKTELARLLWVYGRNICCYWPDYSFSETQQQHDGYDGNLYTCVCILFFETSIRWLPHGLRHSPQFKWFGTRCYLTFRLCV